MKKPVLKSIAAAVALATLSTPTFAYQAGDTLMRLGAAQVSPNDSSGEVLGNDGVSVNSNTQLGLALTHFISDSWAVELLAATPFSHSIYATGNTADVLRGADLSTKIGETKHLPPTLSFQWYPAAADANFQPYLGVGINYTTFFEDKSTDDLTTGLNAVLGDVSSTDIRLSDSVGLSLQAGFDWKFAEQWSLNLGVWYIDIDTEADVYVNDAKALTVDVEIDPWVAMAGVAYQF